MKKKLAIVIVMAILALSALCLVACDHKHRLEHFDAVEATCETEGNVEYWVCSDCGEYFADKGGKEKTTYVAVVTRVLGHDRQEVEAVEPTCTEPGNTEGFTCSRCDYTTVQTIPAGHDMTHHEEVPVKCFENGVKEYWTCSRENNVYYANKAGTATLDELTIYATGHDMTYRYELPAGCVQDGVKAHFACSREPGVHYANEEGSEIIDDYSIPAIGHDMSRVEAIAATCTENGRVAHWVCSHEQGIYYANEQGTRTFATDVVLAVGHDFEERFSSDDTHHWKACKNGCGVEGDKAEHSFGDGVVTKNPTTSTDGERLYTCEDCGKEKTQIIPALGTFELEVVESDIYNNEDGGSVSFVCDRPLEDGRYVEGSVITVTVTLNEGFAIGYIRLNDEKLMDSPFATNGVYTFDFVMKNDTTLTVEFGKPVTTNRVWNLRDNGGVNFAFPWEYYTVDAAQDGYGTAVLYVYDAKGITAREHDFSADDVLFTRELYHNQALKWEVFDQEATVVLLDLMKDLQGDGKRYEYTLALAIRLFPSEAKHASGYVGSALILPTPTTVGGVDYDMTVDYVFSQDNLSAPSTPQFSINDQGTALEFLRDGGAGLVFTKYNAAYIEIEIKNGGIVRYAYMFNDNGTLNIYSNTEKTGTALSCSSVGNAWIATTAFNNWAMTEYPDAYIYVTGCEFRTKIHVDENSYWIYDGEWSSVIKHVGFNAYVTPSFEQMGFSKDGNTIEFIRLGGKGLLFTQYHASYVEIEVKNGNAVYTMYLLYDEQTRRVYLYDNNNGEGEGLGCNVVDNALVNTSDFNAWASAVFEENFNAHECEYRTKVHVDEDNYDGYWFEDGEWSETIKYNA